MVEAIPSCPLRPPPHIYSRDSLAKRFWGQSLALLPLLIAACLTGHIQVLRVLLISLVSAVAFEFLAAKSLKKKENLGSGETVLTALLFSLLVPSGCPSEIAILGIFIAAVAGRECWGGTGAYPLHPVLIARAILQISFPDVMAGPMFLTGGSSLWALVAVGLSGVLLFNQRKSYWETPLLFIVVCFFCEALWGGSETSTGFFSGVLFTAFFLLADPVSLPLTRKGCALFSAGAGLLSSRLVPGGFSIGTAVFALLWMGLLTPWLDVWLKPVPSKTKHVIKATYSL